MLLVGLSLVVNLILFLTLEAFPEKTKFDNYLEMDNIVVHFASSVNAYTAPEDKNKSSICALMDSLYKKNVQPIDHGAYNLDVFEAFLNYSVKQGKKTDLMLFEINMGEFGALWNRGHLYQFEKEKILLKNNWESFFYRPLKVLHWNYDEISKEEFHKTPIIFNGEEMGRVKELMELKNPPSTRKHIRLRIMGDYLYTLTDKHPKIQSLKRMIATAKKSGQKIAFYFTPVDYQCCQKYFTENVEGIIRGNQKFIAKILEDAKIMYVDMSLDAPTEFFSYPNAYPNEHLNEAGRMFVAKQLESLVD